MEFVKFFQSGGPFMYVILVVFAFGVAITIERLIFITTTQSKINKLWKQVTPMLKANDFNRADEFLQPLKNPLATVLQYGLAKAHGKAKRESIEAAIEEGVMEVIPDLDQRTHYLATLANIATLLGLLGTIIGLIQAFTAVASADPAEKADLLSASISVAMNTTAFGLVAAIPMIMVHSYLATKATKLADNIEMAAVKCLNLLSADD